MAYFNDINSEFGPVKKNRSDTFCNWFWRQAGKPYSSKNGGVENGPTLWLLSKTSTSTWTIF